jgi:hypothetical protein
LCKAAPTEQIPEFLSRLPNFHFTNSKGLKMIPVKYRYPTDAARLCLHLLKMVQPDLDEEVMNQIAQTEDGRMMLSELAENQLKLPFDTYREAQSFASSIQSIICTNEGRPKQPFHMDELGYAAIGITKKDISDLLEIVASMNLDAAASAACSSEVLSSDIKVVPDNKITQSKKVINTQLGPDPSPEEISRIVTRAEREIS